MIRLIAPTLAFATIFSISYAQTEVSKTTEVVFSKEQVDKLPQNWTVGETSSDHKSEWTVVAEKETPSKSGFALMQNAKGPKSYFNLCILDDSKFKDGEASVTIKAVDGKLDQGGGIAWRLVDAKNYYLCRYNPLETNLRAYHVIDGKRVQIATKEDLKIEPGSWFTISIKQEGKKIFCSFNGKQYLETADDSFRETGKIGLWSKADARSMFDQIRWGPAK